MKKDYNNIITKENYEGYAELCLYRFLMTKKDMGFITISTLLVMLIGLGITFTTTHIELGALLTLCFTLSTTVATALLVRTNNIKKTLKKYPYIDNNIPNEELINQLEKVGKEHTNTSQAEQVMNNFMEKLENNELKKDVEPVYDRECKLNESFVNEELEKYHPELLTEEKGTVFVKKRRP